MNYITNVLTAMAPPLLGLISFFLGKIYEKKKSSVQLESLKLENENTKAEIEERRQSNSEAIVNFYRSTFDDLQNDIKEFRRKVDEQSSEIIKQGLEISKQSMRIEIQNVSIKEQTCKIEKLIIENSNLKEEVHSLRSQLNESKK